MNEKMLLAFNPNRGWPLGIMWDNFSDVDGVNAVRCEIDGRDATYVTGLDLGEGESWTDKRLYDAKEYSISCEIVGISDDGRALLRELSKETK